MAFDYRCTDHPDTFRGEVIQDVTDHLAEAHPDRRYNEASESGLITCVYERADYGGIRIFGCRTCGTRTRTTDPDRQPFCDDHLDRAKESV